MPAIQPHPSPRDAGTTSPFRLRLAVTASTALVSSLLMSFVGLAVNYGFQPDFHLRWLRVFGIGYLLLVPVLLLIVPPIQGRIARLLGPTSR